MMLQDVLQPCAAITQLLFLVALLAEHKAAKKELHTWQESREALEPLLPFEGEGIADLLTTA